jgi:hypothetical protein
MCEGLFDFYDKQFLKWYNNPDKRWFKLGKFVLTSLRAALFVAFVIVTVYYKTSMVITFPLIAFVALLIYNWRFIISSLLVLLIFLVKIFEILSYCLCISMLTNRFLLAFKKKLKTSIVHLNWSQLDWPCFLNLKYYIYILDTVHYLLYLISVIVIFFVELFSFNSNLNLLIIFILNALLFTFHLVIETYRLVQANRVEHTIRDIFTSDVSFSKRAVALISEEQLGSLVCANLTHCFLLDTQHRAFAHPKDMFKVNFASVPFNKRGVNLVIAYHQTTIQAAKSILTTAFKPSKSGMLGPGIYFANNYEITDHKRNQSTEGGAIFCAKIDLGRVHEMYNKNDTLDYSRYFNSKYLHHGGGDLYDEFVIYNDNQIIEYTIVVEMDAINSYRDQNRKPFCNCI